MLKLNLTPQKDKMKEKFNFKKLSFQSPIKKKKCRFLKIFLCNLLSQSKFLKIRLNKFTISLLF